MNPSFHAAWILAAILSTGCVPPVEPKDPSEGAGRPAPAPLPGPTPDEPIAVDFEMADEPQAERDLTSEDFDRAEAEVPTVLQRNTLANRPEQLPDDLKPPKRQRAESRRN